MIIIVEPHNAEKHAYLLEQMFRLRARIFRDRLGWDVALKDARNATNTMTKIQST
jgi:acyl homoserine lactone synthase